jgi:hypothetical protein
MIGLIFGSVINRLSGAFSALLGFVTRNPLLAALIASLCLSGWLWHRDNVHIHQRDECATARKADRLVYINAEAEASAKAIAALQAQEAHYTVKAKEADHAYQITLSDAHNDADHFIAAGGMRDKAARSASGSAAPRPQGGDSSVPVDVPGFTLVDNIDVRRCSDLAPYSVNAHNWATGLAGE